MQQRAATILSTTQEPPEEFTTMYPHADSQPWSSTSRTVGADGARPRRSLLISASLVAAWGTALLFGAANAQSTPDSLWLGTDNTPSLKALNTDKNGVVLREYGPEEVTGIAIDLATSRLFHSKSGFFGGGQLISIRDLVSLGVLGTITQAPTASFGEDMAFDGTFLYRADYSGGRVQRIDPATGAAVNFITGISTPLGVAWSGSNFYVSTFDTGPIRQYSPNGTPTGVVLAPTLQPGDGFGGLAWDASDGTLWLGSHGTVYHVALDGSVLGSFDVPDGRFVDGLEYQGGVWIFLGFGLAGTSGVPNLVGTGTLMAGSPGNLALSNAKPLSPALLFVSLASTPVPFKGGTLGANPSLLTLSTSTDGAGAFTLAWSAWPGSLPPNTSLYFQYAIKDSAAPAGVALSNAIKGTTP